MHCPGHTRDMFCDLAVEGETWDEFFDRAKQARSESMSPDEQLWWLSGQLWNCTGCLPGHICEELDMPIGSSYA